MAIEWTPDYCLTCDHQCPAGAAYCSQTCRLQDLERASCTSTNSSPKSTASYNSTAPTTPYFQLPPALNFSTYNSSSPNSSFSYSATSSRQRTSLPSIHNSPSRTSLSSQQHQQQDPAYLSDKALRELRDYASCFDQVRDWKRRMTVV